MLLLLTVGLWIIAAGCNSIPELPENTLFQDYYVFQDEWIQVQGSGNMPAVQKAIQNKDGTIAYDYRSVEDRRKICLEDARVDAHTRWLARLGSNTKDVKTWRETLNKNSYRESDWADCLDNARLREYFYENRNTCRVVMVYDCLPEEY